MQHHYAKNYSFQNLLVLHAKFSWRMYRFLSQLTDIDML